MTRNTWQGQVWLVVVEWGLRPNTPTIAVPDGEESEVEAFLDFFCVASEYQQYEWSKETHGDESTTYTIVDDSGDEPTVVARFRAVRPANGGAR